MRRLSDSILQDLEKVERELERRGLKPKRLRSHNLITSLCPFHEETNPSFFIYLKLDRVFYKCFGCGEHGTLRTLMKKLGLTDSNQPKETQLHQNSFEPSPTNIQSFVEISHHALRKYYEKDDPLPESDFFVERGFVQAGEPHRELLRFIDKYKLGVVDNEVIEKLGNEAERFVARIIIPYLDADGNPKWFNARLIDEDLALDLKESGLPDAKYISPSGPKLYLFNEDRAAIQAEDQGFILIVEGEFDAISALESVKDSYPVVGIPGSGFEKALRRLADRLVKHNVMFYTLMDPDDAGKKHAQRVEEIIREKGGMVENVSLVVGSEPFNGDLNDALKLFGKNGLEKILTELVGEKHNPGDIVFIKKLPEIIEYRKNRIVYPTGFEILDEALGGGFREGLHVLGGLTSAGKTSFALKIAQNNALESRPVIYFTYEMSKFELWARIISSLNPKVSYNDLKEGLLPPDYLTPEIERVARNLKILEGNVGTKGEGLYTVDEIEMEARKIKTLTGIAPMVIVDYIQRVPVPDDLKPKTLREKIDLVVTEFQTKVARRIGSPVIVLSAISRSSYEIKQDSDWSKKLSAFKESGGIEFTGYTALLLIKDPKDKDKVTLDILKNRETGKLTSIEFKVDFKNNHWEEWSEAK